MKVCTRCKEEKPIEDFGLYRKGTQIQSQCKPCRNNYRPKAGWSKAQHSTSTQEYLDFVSNPCGICGTVDKQRFVDHDHRCCPTKKSCENCRRGALCGNCNKLLGFAQDDVIRLQQAIQYLESWDSCNNLRP